MIGIINGTYDDYLENINDFTILGVGITIEKICKIVFGFTDKQLFGEQSLLEDDFWSKLCLKSIVPNNIIDIIYNLFKQYFGNDIWEKHLNRQYTNQKIIVNCLYNENIQWVKANNGVIFKGKLIRKIDQDQENKTYGNNINSTLIGMVGKKRMGCY